MEALTKHETLFMEDPVNAVYKALEQFYGRKDYDYQAVRIAQLLKISTRLLYRSLQEIAIKEDPSLPTLEAAGRGVFSKYVSNWRLYKVIQLTEEGLSDIVIATRLAITKSTLQSYRLRLKKDA